MRFFLALLLVVMFSCAAHADAPLAPPLLTPGEHSQDTPKTSSWYDSVLLPADETGQLPSLSRGKNADTQNVRQPHPGNMPTQPDTSSQQGKKTTRNKATRQEKIDRKQAVITSKNLPPPLITGKDAQPSQNPENAWQGTLFSKPLPTENSAIPPLQAGKLPVQAAPVESAPQEETEPPVKIESVLTKKLKQKEAEKPIQAAEKPSETVEMLTSLLELQKNLKQQVNVTAKRLKISTSDAERAGLQEELTQLDKQLSDTVTDFERIATGVEAAVLVEQKPETYSWRDELTSLLEPAIKELKQLTARARQKTQLKDMITEYNKQAATAHRAVENLNTLVADTKNPKIKASLQELLPAWTNAEKRVINKRDLAQMELAKLQDKESSLVQSSSNSIREFFHDRGLYLLLAFLAFIVILLCCRLINRVLFHFLPGARQEKRPFHIRILDIFFQIFSVFSAICGLIFVLYTAEDWFLLSITIIFFLGLAWTVRQALPRMWQQARLMLNLGAVREGERVVYNGIPWKIESLNVFSKLVNPSLGMHLRIPIENMVGLISRPYHPDEPWFPCKKDDWIVIDGKPLAKVVSLSHEQVEVVELGGRRILYQTGDFLAANPANLSRNFSLRAVCGLSYDLQAEITTSIPEILCTFLKKKLDENGYGADCLSLSVDFLQAGASSLDLVVLADFKGEIAPASKRLERALNKWCVDCCNAYNWEIPFPQLTVHRPSSDRP